MRIKNQSLRLLRHYKKREDFGVKSHSSLLTEYRNSTKGKMMTSSSFLELVQLQNLRKKKKMRKQKMNKKKDNL